MRTELLAVLTKYRNHPQFIGVAVTEPNQPGAMGDTILHLASEAGAVEDVEVLVRSGARVSVAGDLGNTPLHAAALMGKTLVAEKLLQLGADAHIKNEFGETAEDVAMTAGHTALANILRLSQG